MKENTIQELLNELAPGQALWIVSPTIEMNLIKASAESEVSE